MKGGAKRNIVVAGDGLAAWATAAALAGTLEPRDYSLVVVGTGTDSSGLPPGLADTTLPPREGDMRALIDDENQVVAVTGASYSFGVALSGWAGPGVTYFHPFGSVGAEFGPVSFHQVVQRLRQEGVAARLANYSLAAMAAQAGRFVHPDGNPRSVLSTCRYGMHIDLDRLAMQKRAGAVEAGVSSAEGTLKEVVCKADGSIAAICTSSGERIEADLFIDCSGSKALLMSETPGSGWEDWSAWLPCDRVMWAGIETPEPPLPYSHAEANPSGWVQYLPLQGRTVLKAQFNSQHGDDENILAGFRGFAGNDRVEAESRAISYGRRRQAWHRNCVALGAAACVIDPVGVSNLHLLATGIVRLLSLLPGEADIGIVSAEYNRQTAAELCHARDFALLHYRLNGRRGEAFWDQARAMAVPASVGYKLQMYANLGRATMYDFEPLEETSWINLFDEHGVQPRQLHPIAEGIGAPELKKHAERVRSVMMDALRKMPLHADYLARINAANSTS